MSRHALLPPSLLLVLAATTTSAFAAAPTASAVSATANEDSSVKITLKGADADHNSITYSVVSNPAHGSVTLSSSSATYKPTANWNGTDTFTYKVRDSTGLDSSTATVTVSVKAVNDAPTVVNATLSATEDTALTTTLSGSDIDGESVRFALTTAPGQGSVTINSTTGAATYTPSANWSGTTTFKYSVSDATSSTTGTVTLNVAAVNDAPTASASSVTLNEDTTASVSVTGADIDSSTLTYTLVNRPAHGSATLSGRALTYTPTSNWSGTDSLTFTVSDGSATSAPATVTFSVAAVNDPPTVTDASTTTNEDTPVTFQLPGSDPEGDRLTWQVEGVTNGSVSVDSSGRATFTPTTNAFGSGRFTFRASDGTSLSGAGTATITLTSVNDAPVATAASVSTTEDGGSVSINLAGSDADNDTLTFALASNPTHGSVAINGHTAVYRAFADYNGADSFTFTVNDGSLTSVPATVSLSIAAVNDPPTAYATSAMTTGSAIAISVDTTDPDSTVGTPTIARAPSHGRASIVSGRIQYTPDAGFIGVDHLAYAVSDGTTTVTGDVKVSSIGSWDGAASEWSQVGVNSIPFYADATSGGIRTASASYQGSYILDDFYDLGLQTYRQLRNADLTWQSVEPSNGLWQTDDSDDVFAQDDVEPRITLFDATFASPTPPGATAPPPFQ